MSPNGNRQLFRSKADTLAYLRRFPELNVPESRAIAVAEWHHERQLLIDDIVGAQFRHVSALAIRSSSRQEDQHGSSSAGVFRSVLNVPTGDPAAVAAAIDSVIDSYAGDTDDQVLIQPMVGNIDISGVILTRNLDDGSPYYVINYDDESGRTDTITSGQGAHKTLYVYRGASDSDFDSPRVRTVVALARRLEEICELNALDIEFARDLTGVLHVFQVRPITTRSRWNSETVAQVSSRILLVEEFVRSQMHPVAGLYGKRTIFGVMADWNPAEMIGITPRALASSLYRDLITDSVWSQARETQGYRRKPRHELMVTIAGRPFIDIRLCFNSFLPEGIDPHSGEALVTAWLDRLNPHPEFHDKVEFDIALTVRDFCFDADLHARYPGVLDGPRRDAYGRLLGKLTASCLDLAASGNLATALQMIDRLERQQAARPEAAVSADIGQQIALRLEECRQLGTLPFAMLARHAFIAESLLRSAVRRGALNPERLGEFKSSIETVARRMSHELLDVAAGGLDPAIFLARYGHLRPGTYDIVSPRYADREGLFAAGPVPHHGGRPQTFTLTAAEDNALGRLLAEAGYATTSQELLTYSRQAIAAREHAKFVFTRSVSEVLELIALWADRLGLDRETMSHLEIGTIMNQSTMAQADAGRQLTELAARGRAAHDLARSFLLGYLIRSSRDVYVVPQHRSAPNFITTQRIEAPVAALEARSSCEEPISGCIVCIESADPGYDWIFSRGIAGLVTKFGGANSHLAIRCAEYGLPAAIGVGVMLFESIRDAKRCQIDAGARTVYAV